ASDTDATTEATTPKDSAAETPAENAGDPDGNPEQEPPTDQRGRTRTSQFARPPEAVKVEAQDQARVPRTGAVQSSATPVPAPRVATPAPAAPQPEPISGDKRRSAGELIERLSPAGPQKSARGWRALLRMAPSQREVDERRDLASVKTVFHRPVTVMVANPKGGSGKTPITALLGAAFGQHRGGGVVAWDNNELRGTLPDRTASPHRRNIHDMLEALDRLRSASSQFTDVAYFLNHQDNGNYYTLGSAQEAGHVVSDQHFRQVHELFARFFQIIIVDTGNNEAAPNWTAAAGEADCLVVPTKWRKDSLIPAARMLESLQDTNPELLERTVIAATNGPADTQKDVKENGASWFGSSHPIVDIPIDPHIAEGGIIDFGLLREPTRRAALRLAAEVATRLIEGGHALD
ncbi:MAG: hypothetical protein Q4F67_01615, partial [Propionibacteriaceae bacterium]|nr:hypothetical protein [Propionibacteriaceae bacterium]